MKFSRHKEQPDGPHNEWQRTPMPYRRQPQLLRVYDESAPVRKLVGTTCLFRNRPLLRTVLEHLNSDADEIAVLIHASSIGCDVYSFIIAWELFFQGRRHPTLKCLATDLSPSFLAQALRATYPSSVLQDMAPEEQAYFEKVDENTCQVAAQIREQVIFLPPSSYVEFSTDLQFDVVFLLNSLLYVPASDQARTLDCIASYNCGLLVTTGFHADQVQQDLRRNNYEPVPDNLELIYESWACRRSLQPNMTVEGITYHTPALEPLRPCDDYHCRFGALFVKRGYSSSAASVSIQSVATREEPVGAGARGRAKPGEQAGGHNSSRPLRIALFNDTGKEAHVGCRGVSAGHEHMFTRLGIEVRYRSFLGEWSGLWRATPSTSQKNFHESPLPSLLKDVDAVVVNGEGTIHHGGGLHLLTILAGAQSLGLPTFLVNAVSQDCEHDLETLRRLDDLTVRDAQSSVYLQSLGIAHRIVFDSIFEAAFERCPAHDFTGKIVVTDWHPARDADVGRAMRGLIEDLGDQAVFYPVHAAERETDWRHAVADLREARLVVTGRHHGVCLAAMAGVPFVALGSNTWKMEGLLSLLPGNLQVCADLLRLSAMCDEAVRNRPLFERVQEFVRAQLPLTTFDKLTGLKSKSRQPAEQVSRSDSGMAWGCGRAPQSIKPTPLARTVPFNMAETELWLDDYLTVCGERRALITGPGATSIVGQLLNRGIDAWGVDTMSGAPATAHGGRCVAGTLADLPLDRGPFQTAMLIGALDALDDDLVGDVLSVMHSAVKGSLQARIFSQRYVGRNRAWWENKFFQAGFRKHPIRPLVLPIECQQEEYPLTMHFERLSESGEAFDAVVTSAPERFCDPSRLATRGADTLLTRYELAATLVRPWDTVLDLGCSCGHGTHLLRRATRGARFIGVDAVRTQVEYAQAHFASPVTEFRCCPSPADVLLELAEASLDFAVCTLPLDKADAVNGLLCGMERVLAPGARLVFTLAGQCASVGAEWLRSQLAGRFLIEAAYRQSGEDINPASCCLREIPLDSLGVGEAVAWLLVVMKDPLARPLPAYRETAFRHVADGAHAGVLRYPEFYCNPWILHALVHGGWRVTSQSMLAETLQRLLKASPDDSADAGAALCILLYRVVAGVVPVGPEVEELVRRAERFRTITSPNEHQFRWQVSITYALAQMALHNGDLSRARALFTAVGDMDVFKWGPSLATKKSEAIFLAGWLAWCADDLDGCRRHWKHGLEFGRSLLARPLDETLINAEFPNLFCAGDGVRELVYALENVGRCGHGLHALRLREQGISCSWEPIFNSFRWQCEHTNASLRLARLQLRRRVEADRHPLLHSPQQPPKAQHTTRLTNPCLTENEPMKPTGIPAEQNPLQTTLSTSQSITSHHGSLGEPVSVAGGFHAPEGDFQWMAKSGSITLRLSEPAILAFEMECCSVEFYDVWPHRVSVSVDGEPRQDHVFEKSCERKAVRLQVKPGDRRVQLDSSSAFVPAEKGGNSDLRQLSVKLFKLHLDQHFDDNTSKLVNCAGGSSTPNKGCQETAALEQAKREGDPTGVLMLEEARRCLGSKDLENARRNFFGIIASGQSEDNLMEFRRELGFRAPGEAAESIAAAVTGPGLLWDDSHRKLLASVLYRAIGSAQTKARVLNIMKRLEPDTHLKGNILSFETQVRVRAPGFETIVFLNWYARSFHPVTYLEIGVRRGRSIAQVMVESPGTQAFGFDLWIPNYAGQPNPGPEFVIRELLNLGVKRLPGFWVGRSQVTVPLFLLDPCVPRRFELINVDGDHTYEGARADLQTTFRCLADGGAIIFDDITHPAHPDLMRLWAETKQAHPECLFLEDLSGGYGTGVAVKPPLEGYARVAARQILAQDCEDREALALLAVLGGSESGESRPSCGRDRTPPETAESPAAQI